MKFPRKPWSPSWLLLVFLVIAVEGQFPSSESTHGALAEKLADGSWILGRDPREKLSLISWLVDGCLLKDCKLTKEELEIEPSEVQSYDGFFNNLFKVDLGAVDSPLLRRLPPVYDDETYLPATKGRPNPFEVSDALMDRSPLRDQNDTAEAPLGSRTGKTALLVFFGQQVVEEILDVQRPGCPPEYFNIEIPKKHRFHTDLKKNQMPLLRSRYDQRTGHSPSNPRQQLNEITPWFDGGLVYGTAKSWADVLRLEVTNKSGGHLEQNPDGKLGSQTEQGLFPSKNDVRMPLANPPPPARHCQWAKNHQTAKVDRFFVLGNPRGNENAFLLTFGVVLFRWHNQFAEYFNQTRPHWSSERKFNEARKWVIATHQQIVYYDWLTEWLGEPLDPYKGYDPSVDPQIEHFFQTAAMRFGHTLVTPGVYMRDFACAGCQQVHFPGLQNSEGSTVPQNGNTDSTKAVRTCNIFWRPQEPLTMKLDEHKIPECLSDQKSYSPIANIDRMLMGMASQRAEREDNMIVEDLRGNVFGPLEFSRRDLMAINIQRGRDHGTPDYNSARVSFGLPRICSAADFIKHNGLADAPLSLKDHILEIVSRMERLHQSLALNETDFSNPQSPNCWNNIDVWTGGILETNKNKPGPLFRAIIKDQFSRIRAADRYWFENTKWEKPRFTDAQLQRIKTLSIFDVLISTTHMLPEDIQKNPFRLPDEEFMEQSPKCKSSQGPVWNTSTCFVPVKTEDGTETENAKTCFQLPQLDTKGHNVEPCTEPRTYDYFSGSEYSFVFTFLLTALAVLGINCLVPLIAALKRNRSNQRSNSRRTQPPQSIGSGGSIFSAREWQDSFKGYRAVFVVVGENTSIKLYDIKAALKRNLDYSLKKSLELINVSDGEHVILKNPQEYDCVLKFDAQFVRDSFIEKLKETFNQKLSVVQKISNLPAALNSAVTHSDREQKLAKFFHVLFPHVSSIDLPSGEKALQDPALLREVLTTELTRAEFAEALGMSLESQFVNKIFHVVDRDKNGYISFREFMELLVILRKDSVESKIKLFFDMYDFDMDGYLVVDEFKDMIKTLSESVNNDINPDNVEELVQSLVAEANLKSGSKMSFEEFKNFFLKYQDVLGYAQLSFVGSIVPQELHPQSKANRRGAIQSVYGDAFLSKPSSSETQNEIPIETAAKEDRSQWSRWIEVNRLHLFWTLLFFFVVFGIFAERAYYYTIEREHGGLRHIAGYGVTITRGAASVQMFCFSLLLLTMCRNIITKLRDTFLHHFFPFDSAITIHRLVAIVGLVFSVVHVVGHGFNFYHISTQTSGDLSCLFREFFRSTHVLPKFHYWCFHTVTGLSGILLVLHLTLMYTFATNYARTHAFRLFWIVHKSYPLFYILMLVHGSGRLVQEPLTWAFLIGPLILFVIDRLISISRNGAKIPVVNAELLPSGVLHLELAKPSDFDYKSGQWVRIACTALNASEFHPFTLSSAPHEPTLKLHIRAVGPFTTKLREIYEVDRPKIYLDGPYGESHQDWWRYQVSVLIGGGIGVTPCASILKDLAHSSSGKVCKKLYFLWITRTQKQFEWLVDILREVENNPLVSIHIFITQLPNKYDLRTALLYACERDFQKSSSKSLFTGLKSVTHFGRPHFKSFFKSLTKMHPEVSRFGVFSCGPAPMNKSVEEACVEANNQVRKSNALFQHHAEVI